MEQVTQKTAANAEESASAGQQLSSQAATMRQIVEQLQVMVGRGKAKNAPAERLPEHGSPAVRESQRPGTHHLAPKPAGAGKGSDAPDRAEAVAAVAKPDKLTIPLDDDFKEF